MLDRNNGCQAFTDILTCKIVLIILKEFVLAGIVVNNTSQGSSETLFMGSTFMGMNVVSETHDILVVTSCVLHGNFYSDVIHFTICVDWCIKDNILVFVDVLNIASNSTFVVVMFCFFLTFSLVCDRNLKTTV